MNKKIKVLLKKGFSGASKLEFRKIKREYLTLNQFQRRDMKLKIKDKE